MRTPHFATSICISALVLGASCTSNKMVNGSDSHSAADHAAPATTATVSDDRQIPPDASLAPARLLKSPRHGEWAFIPTGEGDSLRSWVVYPERSTKAPVVIVIHDIYGMSTWARSIADQLAADGFIAIAPDLLTSKHLPEGPDSVLAPLASAAIRTLDQAQIQRQIDAVARYGMSLPAATRKYGIVGFCWGGGVSFAHAVHAPNLGASVVYYGTSPRTEDLASVRAPVLGLYGGNDARVNATIPAADSALRALGRVYQQNIYPGAGHGFLKQQGGMNGANLTASRSAWPATIAWFRKYLDS